MEPTLIHKNPFQKNPVRSQGFFKTSSYPFPKTWHQKPDFDAPRWCIPSFRLGSWRPSWWRCWRLCAAGCCTTGWKLCWGTQRLWDWKAGMWVNYMEWETWIGRKLHIPLHRLKYPYCAGNATRSINDSIWRWVLRCYRLFVVHLRFDVLKFCRRFFWHPAMKQNLKVIGFEMANVSSLVRNGFPVAVCTLFMEACSETSVNVFFSQTYAPVPMSILCLMLNFYQWSSILDLSMDTWYMAEPLQDQFPRLDPKLVSKQDLSHVWHPCNHTMAWAVAEGVNDSFWKRFSHNTYANAIICLYIWPNILLYDIAATSKVCQWTKTLRLVEMAPVEQKNEVPPPANYVAPDMLQVVLGLRLKHPKIH